MPEGYDVSGYELFQGKPTRVLRDGDVIDIGGRRIEVCHTPGHSPGHMCFWEKERGYLFTGDLVYKDTLFAYYPSTDPEAYLASLERIAALPARKVFPALLYLIGWINLRNDIVKIRNAIQADKEGLQ